MNLILILFFTTLIVKISSSPISSELSYGFNNKTTVSFPMVKPKVADNSYGARSYIMSRVTSLFEIALSYIQSGLNVLMGRGGKDEGGVGRSKRRKVSYRGYQVLRIEAKNQRQLDELHLLPDEMDGIDFWTPPARKYPSDILVSPDSTEDVKEYLRDKSIDYEVLIKDLQKVIAYENPKMTKSQREVLVGKRGHPMTWSRYHRYSDMVRYMEFLVFSFPHLVELITIGYSTEGLPLKVVKVSTDGYYKRENFAEHKPSFWIDGGMHGREWITSSVVMYIIRQLVENYHKYKTLVDSADWYLMPVANPDGYEYSHSRDRLWKKSRSNHELAEDDIAGRLFFGTCEGVDLNQNFDFHWGENGASDDPCHERYSGPRPFSEPETRAIASFIMDRREQMQMFVTLHSYSQMWLVPWSYTKQKTPDYEEMVAMANKAVAAIEKTSGTEYGVGSGSAVFYPTSGASDDWAKGVAGIKYSYKVELRDRGTYGFMLPATQILPTAKETFAAIKTIAKTLICRS